MKKTVLLLFGAMLLITSCKDCFNNSSKSTAQQPTTQKTDSTRVQWVISHRNRTDASINRLTKINQDLGGILVDSCPCSKKLQMWSFPVGIIPRGGDPDDPAGKTGTSQNFDVTNKIFTPNNSGEFKDNLIYFERLISSTCIVPEFPQTNSAKKLVLVGIDDSGVGENSKVDINDLLASTSNPTLSNLITNSSSSLCCGSSISEGLRGMNILKAHNASLSSDPLDEDGHGTFIGGIIAGIAKPTGDFLGANKGVQIKQVHSKFIGSRKENGRLFDALCGIHYALEKKVKVINASWRVRTTNQAQEDSVKSAFYPTLDDVRAKSVLIVAGAGNDTTNLDGVIKTWPACFTKKNLLEPSNDFSKNIISVGAWDADNLKICTNFSNTGSFVDVYAPGTNIHSLCSSGEGTSYAAPYISRTAAILFGLNKGIKPEKVKQKIINSSVVTPLGSGIRLHSNTNSLIGPL